MRIENLRIYPIKSTIGLSVNDIKVNEIGFENDRYLAISNSKNIIVTARENPKLLQLSSEIIGNTIKLMYANKSITISLRKEQNPIHLSLFKKEVIGKTIDSETDKWLSNVLNEECKLVKIDFKNLRTTNSCKISFNDVYPIHLISTESVEKLNEKLITPVNLNRFRPNIIVSGIKAFEEENWTDLIIGECEFKVVSKTKRCSLITINPLTGEKDKKQEPLRTLAKVNNSNGKVNFGIYLIPTKTGTITKTDTIKIKTVGHDHRY